MQELFKTKEVAKIFGVVPRRISKWKKAGIITPSVYVANVPRYTAEDILAAQKKAAPDRKPIQQKSNG